MRFKCVGEGEERRIGLNTVEGRKTGWKKLFSKIVVARTKWRNRGGRSKVLNKIQRTRAGARSKKDSLPHLHISCALFNETYAYQPIVTPTMELYTDT